VALSIANTASYSDRRLHCTRCIIAAAELPASALLTANTQLWTMDKNLAELAARLGVVFEAESMEPE
jgi:hypothetical protein